MTQPTHTCSECGCRMSPSSEGLCPACLLMGVLEHSSAPEPVADAPPARAPQQIEQYELRGELARGGMGIVYRAEDSTTGRVVALKMLASTSFASADELRRFRQEAEAVARLDHPNVVPVYEVGEYEGVPFFVMKLAESGSLAQRPTPVNNRAAASMLLRIARAVQFAHERGVLHRDLKPANILLDGENTPMVCDFGLARLNDRESYTLTGAGIGTPAYMAPEQASGGATPTTTLTDVYGLGAVLYHQLSGGPPFVGPDTLSILRQLANDDPPHPRVNNADADADLSEIALKAMAKNPADRYRSAAGFADDLERWLRGEPTVARPAGALLRFWKWARRKPAAAFAVGVTVVAAIALGAIFAHGEFAIRRERNLALEAEIIARKQERKARDSEQTMRLNLYAADMLVAARALGDGHLGVARETLARHLPKGDGEDLRGFEWYAFEADCRGDDLRVLSEHKKSVLAVAFSPDAKTLATAGRDGRILFWDAATGVLKSELPKADAPTGAMEIPFFAKDAASSPEIRAMLAENPKLFDGIRMRWRPAKIGITQALAWSPDGRWLVSGSPGSYLRVWEVSSGEIAWFAPLASVTKVAFSSDGSHFVAMDRDSSGASGTAVIYDFASRFPVRTIEGIRPSFALLPKGDNIVFARSGGVLERQELLTGTVISSIPSGSEINDITACGALPVIACIDNSATQISLWDIATGTRTHRFTNPNGERFRDIAISPDARELAAVGADHVVRIVDMATFSERSRLRGHGDEILGVTYSPHGTLIATAGNDSTVRLWSSLPPAEIIPTNEEPAAIIAVSMTGPEVLFKQKDGTVESWNAVSRHSVFTPSDNVRDVAAMLPDGNGFLTTRRDGSGGLAVEQWSFDGKLSGPPIVVIPTVPGWRMAAVSVAAGKIAVTDGKKAIETFPLSGPAVPQRLDVERHAFDRMQFSPDGKFLVTFSWPERISVWNISTGGSLGKRIISQGSASAVVISPDSRLIASAGDDNIITIQDIQRGVPIAVLRGHKAQVRALAFSPDGKTLASASSDQTLRLWHCATWREMGVLQRGTEYTSLAFVGSPPRLVAIGPRGRVVFEGANAR